MTDHAKQLYGKAWRGQGDSGWRFLIFRYDPTGNHIVVTHRSEPVYRNEADALDGASEYCAENDIEADIIFPKDD